MCFPSLCATPVGKNGPAPCVLVGVCQPSFMTNASSAIDTTKLIQTDGFAASVIDGAGLSDERVAGQFTVDEFRQNTFASASGQSLVDIVAISDDPERARLLAVSSISAFKVCCSPVLSFYTHLKVLLCAVCYNFAKKFCEFSSVFCFFVSSFFPVKSDFRIAFSVSYSCHCKIHSYF